MKKKIILAAVTALVVLMTFTVTGVYAKTASELDKELSDTQKKLNKGTEQEESLEKQISKLEKQITKKEAELVTLSGDILDIKADIKKNQAKVEKVEKKLDEQKSALGKRLRKNYKGGTIGYIDVILGSKSISDFLNNIDMIQRIYESDNELRAGIEKNYNDVKAQKKKLSDLNDKLKSEEKKQAKKKELLTADKDNAADKKSRIAASNDELKKQIDALNKERSRITDAVDSDTSPMKNKKYKGGKFTWPVPGHTYISSGYGPRWGSFHYGIDIPAAVGTKVVAGADGIVIKAGPAGSYGNMVMISHGSGLYTLYAHNSVIVTSVGARVKRGQTIAKIGCTGNVTGPHCHFEVYKGGTGWGAGYQMNPLPYLGR